MTRLFCRREKKICDTNKLINDLTSTGIVFFGEKHEVPSVLVAELEILDLLYGISADITLGLEHFNYKQQWILDEYLSESLEWEKVKQAYARGYEGFNLDFYRPLLDYARNHGIKVYGLMAPREYARQVSRNGLEALESLECIVRPGDIWLGPPSYRRSFFKAVDEALKSGPMGRLDPEKLFFAQAYKDEVASRMIARIIKDYPGERLAQGPPVMMVVMGSMHVGVEGSVPSRLARLVRDVSFKVIVAEPGLREMDLVSGLKESFGLADYFVVS
ncbi:MAG: ChaN family lipoprotein [Desulfurococcales archaeon]|nr:ChaN family lipoprotein [Desulfurococcales archaeon]